MKTIFVSSTFQDMQYERDAIQSVATPIINEAARKYGERVSFCDLRWGVNTTDYENDEGAKKVLDVCLNEIDRCRPYMIVLLGERYGWVPNRDLISRTVDDRRIEIDDLEQSVTSLEIEYGALGCKGNIDKVLFYFREIEGNSLFLSEAESKEYQEKLKNLKQRIQRVTNGKVKYYKVSKINNQIVGIDIFARMLAEDLIALLKSDWEISAKLTPFEKDRRVHNTFAKDNSQLFCIREELLHSLIQDVENKEPLIVIRGRCGSGKSVFLSKLATSIKNDNYDVLFYSCGLTADSTSAYDIFCGIIRLVSGVFKFSVQETEDIIKDPEKQQLLFKRYSESERALVLLVDGLEKLLPTESRDNLDFLPNRIHGQNIICVIGCDETITIRSSWLNYEWNKDKVYHLSVDFDADEKVTVLKSLIQVKGKEIGRPVFEHIIKDSSISTPFYLELIMMGLLSMGKEDFDRIRVYGNDMNAINKYQIELIDSFSRDEDELSASLLIKYCHDSLNNSILHALFYLSISYFGLTDNDFMKLIEGYCPLSFVHFTTLFQEFFIRRGDRYDFAHQSVRRGLLKLIPDSDRYRLNYIRVLEDNYDDNYLQEITYHLIAINAKDKFVRFIEEWSVNRYSRDKNSERGGDRAFYNAAKALFYDCMNNGGKWIVSIIENRREFPLITQRFYYFIGFYFINFLDHNRNDELNEAKVSVCEALISALLDANVENDNEKNELKRNLADVIYSLADAYFDSGKKAEAISLYKKYVSAEEKLAFSGDEVHDFSNLDGVYGKIGRKFETLDSEEYLIYAIELYLKRFRLELNKEYIAYMRENYFWAYLEIEPERYLDSCARLCTRIQNKEKHKEVIGLLKQEIAKKSDNDNLALFLCEEVIDILKVESGEEAKKEIVYFCRALLGKMDLIASTVPSNRMTLELFKGYKLVVETYLSLNIELHSAKLICERAECALLNAIDKTNTEALLNSEPIKHGLFLHELIELCDLGAKSCKEDGDIRAAIEWSKKEVEYRIKEYKEDEKDDLNLSLIAYNYGRIAGLLESLPDYDGCDESRSLREKAIAIFMDLYNAESDAKKRIEYYQSVIGQRFFVSKSIKDITQQVEYIRQSAREIINQIQQDPIIGYCVMDYRARIKSIVEICFSHRNIFGNEYIAEAILDLIDANAKVLDYLDNNGMNRLIPQYKKDTATWYIKLSELYSEIGEYKKAKHYKNESLKVLL